MFEELDSFAPGLSKKFDWKPVQAGQRVQIIKDGDLQMGTEILVSKDKTYGTLLGASPGASVSPEVMLRCLEQLIPSVFSKEEARQKKSEIFPEDDLDTLISHPGRYREVRDAANLLLGIIQPKAQ
jgi:malate dehydrogenase (quinone)